MNPIDCAIITRIGEICRLRKILLGAAILWMLPAWVVAAPVTLGILRDGPSEWEAVPTEALVGEIRALLGEEFEPRFPQDKQRTGNWSLAGVGAALDALLADPQVDVVLAMGLLASHVAAHRAELPKPVIATAVADAELQGFPLRDGASGRRNLVYIASFRGIDEEMATFHELVGFEHLAVMVDRVTATAIPELSGKAAALSTELGIQVSLVPVEADVEQALAALPPDSDAVYVTPLPRLPPAQISALSRGLVDRRLPSFSLLGRSEVERGLLMTIGGLPSDNTRFARRIALNLQRILLGEDAGGLAVAFSLGTRLTLNMRTARAIGFLPRWAVLVDAEKLFDEEPEAGRPLSLRQAMREGLEANLALQAAALNPRIAGDDVTAARAALLPQLGVSAATARIDADRANPLAQAERSLDAELVAEQLLYSEQRRAGLDIARHLERAARRGYEAAALDTLQASASSYLTVLRARALEKVQQSNLEVTRTNLELARVREKIGATGRADVLRWESQIAGDRQNLLAAQADRRRAEVELNRTLHRPLAEVVSTADPGVDQALAVAEDPRFDAFIGNPAVWQTFQDFSVRDALANAPELREIEAALQAQERAVLAARRAYYVPDVGLRAAAGRNLDRSGAGSDLTGTGLDDETWSIGVEARLPLFSGGALRAERSRTRHALVQLRMQEASLAESIEARVRAALHRVGGSYPAIELSQSAARAAASNLALVTDAYAKGALSVTALIDAQDAALAAELAAAQAVYGFLLDYVEVLRASGSFDLLLGTVTPAEWYVRIDSYFKEQGVEPLRR